MYPRSAMQTDEFSWYRAQFEHTDIEVQAGFWADSYTQTLLVDRTSHFTSIQLVHRPLRPGRRDKLGYPAWEFTALLQTVPKDLVVIFYFNAGQSEFLNAYKRNCYGILHSQVSQVSQIIISRYSAPQRRRSFVSQKRVSLYVFTSRTRVSCRHALIR